MQRTYSGAGGDILWGTRGWSEPQGTGRLPVGRGQIHLAGGMCGPVGRAEGSIHSCFSRHTTFFANHSSPQEFFILLIFGGGGSFGRFFCLFWFFFFFFPSFNC